MCHETVDLIEIFGRVRAIDDGYWALGNDNKHTDKDVQFIGRYDRAWYPNTPEYGQSRARF